MMRVAAIQLNSKDDREANVKNALALIDQAAEARAEFVVLPEYLTFLGAYEHFHENAESIPGFTSNLMSEKAKQHKIYLHIGSLIERSHIPGRFFNSSIVFNPQGEQIGYYRKVHLFDIDIPGQVTDTESNFILSGEDLSLVELPDFKIGMSICFDIRFPEIYRQLALAGASLFVLPAAFSAVTGKAHWDILLRARAIENHAYLVAAGQCGQDTAGNRFYGHSMIVDPWGIVLAEAKDNEQIVIADIDIEEVKRRRQQIRVLQFCRPEVYTCIRGGRI